MRNVLLTNLSTPELVNSQLRVHLVHSCQSNILGRVAGCCIFPHMIWGVEKLEIMLFRSRLGSAEPPEERTSFPGSLIRNFHMGMPSRAVRRSRVLVRYHLHDWGHPFRRVRYEIGKFEEDPQFQPTGLSYYKIGWKIPAQTNWSHSKLGR